MFQFLILLQTRNIKKKTKNWEKSRGCGDWRMEISWKCKEDNITFLKVVGWKFSIHDNTFIVFTDDKITDHYPEGGEENSSVHGAATGYSCMLWRRKGTSNMAGTENRNLYQI